MTILTSFLAVMLVMPSSMLAQSEGTEYQGRILAHAQLLPKTRRVGFAAWGIFPNVAKTQPFRGLVLSGPLYKDEKRWAEFMAGVLISSDGADSFELDMRILDRSLKRIDFFVETEYVFRARKLFVLPNATTPVRVKKLQFRVGVEADVVFTSESTLFVLGPRVVVPLPICRKVCKSASLTTAYRFPSEGRKVLRQYVAFNF